MTLDELLHADIPWPDKREQLIRWPYEIPARPVVDSWAESQRAMIQGLPDIDTSGSFTDVVSAADQGVITQAQLLEVARAREAARA